MINATKIARTAILAATIAAVSVTSLPAQAFMGGGGGFSWSIGTDGGMFPGFDLGGGGEGEHGHHGNAGFSINIALPTPKPNNAKDNDDCRYAKKVAVLVQELKVTLATYQAAGDVAAGSAASQKKDIRYWTKELKKANRKCIAAGGVGYLLSDN